MISFKVVNFKVRLNLLFVEKDGESDIMFFFNKEFYRYLLLLFSFLVISSFLVDKM